VKTDRAPEDETDSKIMPAEHHPRSIQIHGTNLQMNETCHHEELHHECPIRKRVTRWYQPLSACQLLCPTQCSKEICEELSEENCENLEKIDEAKLV
jgi:hypothetical protein